MPDLMNIASTGIAASQTAINITGQNIANVSTVGYSREKVTQQTVTGGLGTQVTNISRIYNEFLANQANSAVTTSSASSIQYSSVQPLNAILTDPNAGVSPAMNGFFNALQGVANQASDIAPRQIAIGAAQNLVTSINNVQATIDSINTDINTQLTQSVANINSYADQIVALNKAIDGTSDPSTLNNLEDQRDTVINSLSKEIKVTVNKQNNEYIVSVGNGIPLMDSSTSLPLNVFTSDLNPNQLDVGSSVKKNSTLNAQSLAGGTVGGLIDFRTNILNPASNSLGLVALGLTTQVNNAQSQGNSLLTVTPPALPTGPQLFSVGQILVSGSKNNQSNTSITATFFQDPANLDPNAFLKDVTTSDYTVSFDGSKYSMVRNSDNTTIATSNATAFPIDLVGDGLDVSIPSGLMSGDTFKISPTANAARNFSLLTTEPLAIAAAGSGFGAVISGDNTNMVNLLNVKTQSYLKGGTNTLNESYNQFISTIGNQAHQLQIKSTFDETVATKSSQALQNVSGVNLDEEAANLIRFQQAYQASGKVMQIAKQMFDGLLSSLQ
jgi:flagellar hook-associated protein 1 FlgK